jgi:hypothetical protein
LTLEENVGPKVITHFMLAFMAFCGWLFVHIVALSPYTAMPVAESSM